MKESLGLHRRRHVALDSVRWLVGDSTHLRSARAVAEKSITLVRDAMTRIPLRRGDGSILSITVARRTDLGAGVSFNSELRRAAGSVIAEFVAAEDIATLDRSRLVALADSAGSVVLSYYVGQSWDSRSANAPAEFVDLVNRLGAAGRRFVLVSFGNPYLLQQVEGVGTYMIAWGGFPVSQVAAARAAVGERSITGKLPMGIPPMAKFGDGVERIVR